MAPRIACNFALAGGGFFILLALAGILPNPLVGPEGSPIVVEGYVSIAHAVVGAYLLAMGLTGETSAAFALFSSSVVCASFGGVVIWHLGSAETGYLLDRSLLVNKLGGYLHVGTAFILAVGGSLNTSKKQLFYQ